MKAAFVTLFSAFFICWLSTLVFWMAKNIKAKSWPVVRGVVEHSATPASGRRKFSVIVGFRYQVNGVSYYSDRLRFGSQYQTHSRGFARMVRAKFSAGTHVDVYCDPVNPSNSVLLPGMIVGDLFFIVFLFAFLSFMLSELVFS